LPVRTIARVVKTTWRYQDGLFGWNSDFVSNLFHDNTNLWFLNLIWICTIKKLPL